MWARASIAVGVAAVVVGGLARPAPSGPSVIDEPAGSCEWLGEQPWMTHIFDTGDLPGGPYYVNDHTLVQSAEGYWHLIGIFKKEPMGDDLEVDFIHAVAMESDPAKWTEGAFRAVGEPHSMALRADPAIGETHLWAPHVLFANGRYWMVYNGGGKDDDHASMRLAVSDDLYVWTRVSLLFEDFCAARDPMIVGGPDAWTIYYTCCESLFHKVSGVAMRTSADLLHWSAPSMALTMGEDTLYPNSGFSESPFVFERNGQWILSLTSYPREWDGTYLYRSSNPRSFPNIPFAKLRSHAGEWVFDLAGHPFITHAGPGQRGVWLASVTGL